MDDLVHSLCHPVVPNSRCHTPVLHEWWHSLAAWLQDTAGSHSHDANCYSLGSSLEKSNTTDKIRNFSIGRQCDFLGQEIKPSFLSDLHIWHRGRGSDDKKWAQGIPTRWQIPLVSQKPPAVVKAIGLLWQIGSIWFYRVLFFFFFACEKLTLRFKPGEKTPQSTLRSQKESHDKHTCSLWHRFPRK